MELTLSLILLIILALIVMQIVAGRTGRDAGLEWKDFRIGTRLNPRQEASTEAVKFRAALERYDDLSQGLVAIVEAVNQDQAFSRHDEWSTHVAAGLGQALTVGSRETYRVAVWLDIEDEGVLIAMGRHLTNTEELDRDRSVAGLVCRQRKECYVRDIRNDPAYIWPDGARTRKEYASIFGVPWGPAELPDGAITVDAKRKDGFSAVDMEIVRAFAGLVAAGWAAYNAERAEHESAAHTTSSEDD